MTTTTTTQPTLEIDTSTFPANIRHSAFTVTTATSGGTSFKRFVSEGHKSHQSIDIHGVVSMTTEANKSTNGVTLNIVNEDGERITVTLFAAEGVTL